MSPATGRCSHHLAVQRLGDLSRKMNAGDVRPVYTSIMDEMIIKGTLNETYVVDHFK